MATGKTKLSEETRLKELTAILDDIPGGVAIYAQRGNLYYCLSVNKYLAQLLGVARENLIGQSVNDLMTKFLAPGEEAHFLKAFQALKNGRINMSGTYRCKNIRKNTIIWLHLNGKIIVSPEGEQLFYCTYTNVDKLMKVEKELRETHQMIKERYARALNLLRENNEGNVVAKGYFNLTRNKILEYTTYLKDVYQSSTNVTYDAAFAKMLELPYVETEKKKLAETLNREKLLTAFKNGETRSTVVFRRVLDNSKPMWLKIIMQTFQVPKTRDIKAYSYSYDITQKKLQDTIIDRLSVLGYDELGIIYTVSGYWRGFKYGDMRLNVHNTTRPEGNWDEEIARFASENVVVDQRHQVLKCLTIQRIKDKLATMPVYNFNVAVSMEDGTIRQKQIQFSYLNDVRETIFYCVIDTTEQFVKQNEQLAKLAQAKLEAMRSNEAKSAFLSSMSHDLRTPLNGVLGYTQLAIDEKDPTKKQDYLKKIKISGDLLLDLVNDTLDLSRIESGKLELKPEAMDDVQYWKEVVTAMEPAANVKQIKLLMDSTTWPHQMIMVDRIQVKKILVNLISNAIKYTKAGGIVKVNVQALKPEKSECTRRITVEDNGIGMSKEFLGRMFEPFSQEHRSEMLNVTGTGLGLFIVKKIVDFMGGTIAVESALHQGTKFVVDLPLKVWDKNGTDDKKKEADQKKIINESLANRRILLCEDNYLNAEIAQLLLKNKKVAVDWAKDGKEGVEKFSGSEPNYYDAILMDIRMPILDGLAATEAIRNLERQDAATIPVIAMTADAFEETINEAKNAGMDAYVTKPIVPTVFYKTIAEKLQG